MSLRCSFVITEVSWEIDGVRSLFRSSCGGGACTSLFFGKIISGRKCICLQECWNSFEIGIWCEKLLFFEGLRLIYVESAIDKPELVGIIKKIYKVVGNNRTRVIVSINPRNLGERRDIHEGK